MTYEGLEVAVHLTHEGKTTVLQIDSARVSLAKGVRELDGSFGWRNFEPDGTVKIMIEGKRRQNEPD